MKVLILAAGRGSRLHEITKRKPKPAIEICGVPLILRNFFILRRLNAEVVVVVGYKADIIKEIFEKEGITDVEFVRNDDLERGNAYSALCAKSALKHEAKFVVLMGDHIFSESFLRETLRKAEEVEGNYAIVCSKNDFIDEGEATKILAKDGEVHEIGKNLSEWTHIDTGAFICTNEIFDILEEIFRKKREVAWSDVVRTVKMKIHEINDFWMDIDTIDDLKRAEKALLKQLIKEDDGIISKNINRKISLRISSYLSSFNIDPNAISIASFSLSIAASFLFLLHSYILAGILAQISSIIDGVDGEIARLKFKTTKFGGFFDAVLDRYADFILLSCIFLSLPFNIFDFLAFLFAISGSSLVSYTASKFKETFGERAEHFERFSSFIPAKRDERTFLIFVFSILAALDTIFIRVLLISLAILTNFRVIMRIMIAKNLKD